MSNPADFAATAAEYFLDLQARIVAAFESFEPSKRFQAKTWSRPEDHRLKGGGEMRSMRGDVFEKVGVNFSHVWGVLESKFRSQIPGAEGFRGQFRCLRDLARRAHVQPLCAGRAHESALPLHEQELVRRGADLTPTFLFEEDTKTFHDALRSACDGYRPDAYADYKAWCDKYFYLPHREEPRGVGGIFFDELASGATERDFGFVRSVGEAFLAAYPDPGGAPEGHAVRRSRAREAFLQARAVRRVQSGLRPGHALRLRHRCGPGGLPDELAAHREMVRRQP